MFSVKNESAAFDASKGPVLIQIASVIDKLVFCSRNIVWFFFLCNSYFVFDINPCLIIQVYSSTEHLATPSNLSFSSDRSHSEDKEDRGDTGGLSPSPASADGSFEHRHTGRMAK